MASITAVTPVTGKQGESTAIRIVGAQFSPGFSPSFVDFAGVSHPLTNAVVASGNIITCEVPNILESGLYQLRVFIQDENDLQLDDAFIIVPETPSYPFTDSYSALMTRMIERLPDGYDKREGQTFFNVLSPVALELSEIKLLIRNAVDLTLIEKTSGSYLDFKALEFGLIRLPATKSFGTVDLVSDSEIHLASGALELQTNPRDPDNTTTIFILDQSVDNTIPDGNGDFVSPVKIVAKEAGALGNFPANNIDTVITSGYTNLIVKNASASALTGGSDIEDDINFRIRVIRRMFSFPRAGNIADYERWSREASNYVGKVQVIRTPSVASEGISPIQPTYNLDQSVNQKGGRVHIHFLMRDGEIPPKEIIDEVQNYIFPEDKNGVAPIGADVRVYPSEFVNIYVKGIITVIPGFDDIIVHENVTEALEVYLNGLEINQDVIIIKVGQAIFNVPGVNTLSEFAISFDDPPMDTEVGNLTIEINKKAKADSETISIT